MPEPDELDEVGDVLKLLLQQDNFEATEFGISDLPVDEADKINENNGYDRDNKDKQPNDNGNDVGKEPDGVPINSVDTNNFLGMALSFNPVNGPIFNNPEPGKKGSIGEGGEGPPRWSYEAATSPGFNDNVLFKNMQYAYMGDPKGDAVRQKEVLNTAFCAIGISYAFLKYYDKNLGIKDYYTLARTEPKEEFPTIHGNANSMLYKTSYDTNADLIVFTNTKDSNRMGCAEVNYPVPEYGTNKKTDDLLDKLGSFQGCLFTWGTGGSVEDKGSEAKPKPPSGHIGIVLGISKTQRKIYTLEFNTTNPGGSGSERNGRCLVFRTRDILTNYHGNKNGNKFCIGFVNTGKLKGGAYAPKGIGNMDYLEQIYGIKMSDFNGPARDELAAPTGIPPEQENNNNNPTENDEAQENKSFQARIKEMDCNQFAAMWMELKANPGLSVYMMGLDTLDDEVTGESDSDVFVEKCEQCENEVAAADPMITKPKTD